jgi:ssDNA-binding Zn-finger/Zn-ribbon topoisomerase 1
MTARVYVYKITFEGMPFWYWGAHKERKFGEAYLGSPSTNKWYWQVYKPSIQILQLFDNTPKGWEEARKLEQRLIRADLDNPNCLNEHCGGTMSIKALKHGGKVVGRTNVQEKRGIFNPEYQNSEERKAKSVAAGKNSADLKVGVHGRTSTQKTEDRRKGGLAGSRENKQKAGRLGAQNQTLEDKRKGGVNQKIEDKAKGGKTSANQVWESTVDGYRGMACLVARHNKNNGWDPNARRRVV